MASVKELQGLVYSISKQLRLAGLIAATERLELNPPGNSGKPWHVAVVRSSGVRYLADFSDAKDGIGMTKPQSATTLKAVLRVLVSMNGR